MRVGVVSASSTSSPETPHIGTKILWVKIVNISIQGWHKEGGITLGDGAWLRLVHQIEWLVEHWLRVCL